MSAATLDEFFKACDRCGARCTNVAYDPKSQTSYLLLCGHHTAALAEPLVKVGWELEAVAQ